ncbi:hypothetical protein TVAG_187640 [Trichomonas vaginalis G3]|uniref:DUF3447 domain-containing protein n=1 Tax=Trichomonas vaginalis (strain ATCC PRA-98 / G3) TaxID=412133 RepID=A2DUY6_TRIV3|nr:temperature-gated cation channel protein [Trichomonas vaginalis G3]EAY15713.1 hypothetical protein TVAG_187640 [Trichomonas vaginalis G3]KAI5486460.1 temperature-gated cation channel protein [Trichomonas vaginalis G3]|eukprot:XP_001327936.1 hypothetical protein [Trichomonas vaginalis G3]
MSDQLLNKYDDFIETYEKLFHLNSNDSVEEILNLISSVLIKKYKAVIITVVYNLFMAARCNYQFIELYIKILNQFLSKYRLPNSYVIELANSVKMTYSNNPNGGLQVDFDRKSFPKEGEILYIIMNDQIDKFKEYVSHESIESFSANISVYQMHSPIEACCYFGSVNIFFFLLTNLNVAMTPKCLLYSIFGRNTDIINECMKNIKMNKYALESTIASHNYEFLEYLFKRDLIDIKNIDTTVLSRHQNLKALLLLYENDKNSIIPCIVSFPQALDFLQDKSLDLTRRAPDGKNVLICASYWNNFDIRKYLLDNSTMKINSKDKDHRSALHYAVKNNNKNLVELLFNHGAKVDNFSDHKHPLHFAAKLQRNEMIPILLKHGADINKGYGVMQRTALHIAAKRGYLQTLEVLIKNHADINVKDFSHETPLHYATKYNKKKQLNFLFHMVPLSMQKQVTIQLHLFILQHKKTL